MLKNFAHYLKISNKLRFYLCVSILACWIVLMMILSLQNGDQTAQTSGVIANFLSKLFYGENAHIHVTGIHMLLRKIAHVGLYAVFGALCCLTLSSFENSATLYISAFSDAIVIVFSFADELCKMLIPGRHFDLFDVMLDILGGSLACLLYYIIVRMAKKSR